MTLFGDTSGALRLLGEALLESDAVALYPERVVDPERAAVGGLCLDVADAHRPAGSGRCVGCGRGFPCEPFLGATSLALEHVVVATTAIVRRCSLSAGRRAGV